MARYGLRFAILVGWLGAMAARAPVFSAQANQNSLQSASVAIITSPGSGALLTGLAPVVGTAADEDFAQYLLEFAPDPPVNDTWFAIQPPVAQQVQDGVLGAWDTSGIEDGRYLIRLRVIRNDGTEFGDQVRVFINNATATPTHTVTPPPTPTATPQAGQGGAAITATPLIWQPPTRTPRPGIAGINPTPTPRSIDLTGAGPFQSELVRRGVRNGAFLALAAFGSLGAYQALRMVVRRGPKAVWRQFQREAVRPLLNSIRRKR